MSAAPEPGRFITLEGIEGVGKSTAMSHVSSVLEASGLEVVSTREPGGTPLAERIRAVLLAPTEEAMPAEAELLLMFAARAAHVANLVQPALERGTWVVCDRFTDATLAYQGGGRGASIERIRTLAGWVHGDLWPDLTLWLDAPVEVGLERARRRGAPDRFEQESLTFFSRVRGAYLALAEEEPDRIVRIDAARPIDEVGISITRVLQAFFGELQ